MPAGRKPNECRRWRSTPLRKGRSYRRWKKGSMGSSMSAWRKAGSLWRSGKMKFDELDEKMRVFETAADYCVLPGIFMVARLDGRSFTRLTKEVWQFEAPFDQQF